MDASQSQHGVKTESRSKSVDKAVAHRLQRPTGGIYIIEKWNAAEAT
jgi:hypothetical protein